MTYLSGSDIREFIRAADRLGKAIEANAKAQVEAAQIEAHGRVTAALIAARTDNNVLPDFTIIREVAQDADRALAYE